MENACAQRGDGMAFLLLCPVLIVNQILLNTEMLLYALLPYCVEFTIIDIYALLVIIPYIRHWVLRKKSRIALGVLIVLNSISVWSHITSLSLFDSEGVVGDCYRFSSEFDRKLILFLLLAILIGLPIWHYKYRDRSK